MYLRDALDVLFNGLPPTQIERVPVTVVEHHSIPPGAVATKVYYADHKIRFSYGDDPKWEGKYFRTCKDAFEASNGEATVISRDAYVTPDGDILIGSFRTYRFFGEEHES
jgi:hypothetical protein